MPSVGGRATAILLSPRRAVTRREAHARRSGAIGSTPYVAPHWFEPLRVRPSLRLPSAFRSSVQCASSMNVSPAR
jgi:hypothetical protein